jgi:hypothetical protein
VQFHEKYLRQGINGGLEAADAFMKTTQEYLKTLGSSIRDAENVQVVVKAYANLEGQSRVCFKNKKLVSCFDDMSQFWIGFTRKFSTFDFVDVGPGKEEADHRLCRKCSIEEYT